MSKTGTRIKTRYAGVYYRINKNGTKVFYVTYRENHRTKELKVGTYDEGMRVEEANRIRLSIVSSIRLGTDAPHILHTADKHEKITFDSLVERYFTSKELHNTTNKQSKGKYRYHYMNKANEMIFRYDNAKHYPGLKTFPHHKHVSSETVLENEEPDMSDVLIEIEKLISR